jgi:2,3-dihydroxy-p-cumate/2,3-dihydroxybenzoate 3,4-dioxygenase
MIRYKKLGYVELNVSDLAASEKFYRDIVGLEYVGKGDGGSALFRCDSDHHSVVLHQKKPAGFRCVGWMLEDESQFANLHRRLREQGVPYEELSAEECKARTLGRATRMVEQHTQATIEFYVPPNDGKTYTFTPSHTKIMQLGHVVFHALDQAAGTAFFRDVLNFRESDSIGENITFLRPFPNPYHHGMGVGAGKPVFHHLNFMVTEIDDIGRGLNRVNRNKVPVVFGPGKHPASGSVFLYYLEPDGMTLEYSFGMEEFTEVDPRAPRVIPLSPENIDAWGSPRDPRMSSSGAMDAAKITATVG